MPTLAVVARGARATAALALVAAALGLAPVAGAQDRRAHRSHDRERLDRLLREPNPSAERLYALGNHLLREDDLDGAARAFSESARRSTRPGNAYYNLACALALRGSTGEALDALQAALDGGYDDPDHMAEDEDLESLHGDPRFAGLLRDAEALESPPVNPRAWHRWRWDGRDDGQRESRAAAARLEAYLAAHPRSGRAAYGVGIARLNLDDHEAAARAFLRALELGYRPAATLYNLACVEARRGRVEEAFRHLDRAIEAGFHEPWQIRSDDDLDALHGDPRFRAAVRRAGELARAEGHRAGGRGWSWIWGGEDEGEDD
jgi:tetratricopeptide (TPR) repeat protein